MKYKDKQTLRKASVQDLMKEAEELAEKLKKIQVDRHVKQLKNVREGKQIRKRRAVLLTYVREKQLI